MLYWQFKQVLDDKALVYSAELARFELARTLTEYTCLLFDSRMDELKKKDPMFKGFTMEYLKLSNVSRLMNLASANLGIKESVDMNTKRCIDAFDVLVRKLSDGGIIANAIK